MATYIAGVGAYLPEKVMTNQDLEKTLDTSHEWIVTRTGVVQRHIAADGELTSHLAIKASEAALDDAKTSPEDIDLIILATATPDHIFPATAVRVQKALGAAGAAFDVAAVCGGFVFALATADAYIQSGAARCVLVIGAETMSRIVDWSDRATAVLFGDGAGAFVLKASETKQGILGCALKTDGQGYDDLYVDGGVSVGRFGFIKMNGQEVFKRAIRDLSSISQTLLKAHHTTVDDLDWVVPHQANVRIIEAVRKRLEVPQEKMYLTVSQHANTSAASVPLAFVDGVKKGQIQRGQLILSQVFGAGFAWGATLFRY
ncbi:beta-ketoacyl-ACP synthase III [Candidatus Hepatobacter penaei]|uniref:beta-ketoacyl-ACP synthase III n=1 Tax=Candidatus Hepatobacter penaei TaxID=1274402 RepID=UPI0004F2A728|nr:beta-ketoacyl-ACP synthase III [Candidatus Hepatobacter penaei]TGW15193.1 ketoacyl-ACP synthase III [bacterium NHP-B]